MDRYNPIASTPEVDVPDFSLLTFQDDDLTNGASGTANAIQLTGLTSPNPSITSDVDLTITVINTPIIITTDLTATTLQTGSLSTTTLDTTNLVTATLTIPSITTQTTDRDIVVTGDLIADTLSVTDLNTDTLDATETTNSGTSEFTGQVTFSALKFDTETRTNIHTQNYIRATATSPVFLQNLLWTQLAWETATGPGNGVYFSISDTTSAIAFQYLPEGFIEIVVHFDFTNNEGLNFDAYMFVHSCEDQPQLIPNEKDDYSMTNDALSYYVSTSAMSTSPGATKVFCLRTRRPYIPVDYSTYTPPAIFCYKTWIRQESGSDITVTGPRSIEINHVF